MRNKLFCLTLYLANVENISAGMSYHNIGMQSDLFWLSFTENFWVPKTMPKKSLDRLSIMQQIAKRKAVGLPEEIRFLKSL